MTTPDRPVWGDLAALWDALAPVFSALLALGRDAVALPSALMHLSQYDPLTAAGIVGASLLCLVVLVLLLRLAGLGR